MEEKKESTTKKDVQVPAEGIVIGHELVENGTKLIIIVGHMEVVPRKVKFVW